MKRELNLSMFETYELWTILLFFPFLVHYLISIGLLIKDIVFFVIGWGEFSLSTHVVPIIYLFSLPAISNLPGLLIEKLYARAGYVLPADDNPDYNN